MKKILPCMIVSLLVVFFASSVFAVDKAERISDREIVESLAQIRGDIKALSAEIKAEIKSINQRIDDMNKQLDRMSAIFTALVVAVIGFAYWDRRTIIRKAKEETIAEIEKEGRLKDMVSALRELSKTDEQVARVLKQFGLL